MTVIMVLGVMFALLLAGLPVAYSLGVLGLGMLCLLYTSDAADE